MAIEGKINLEDFYAIYEHGGEVVHLPFVHSTRSYPEWPFAKVKHTPDELAEKMATALLEMPWDCAATRAARCAGWTIPLNYQPVHDCLKELKVGPYKDLGKILNRPQRASSLRMRHPHTHPPTHHPSLHPQHKSTNKDAHIKPFINI